MNPKKIVLFGFLAGLALTIMTALVPKETFTVSDLQNLTFGFPFWFIQQDHSGIHHDTIPLIFPMSPWEYPTDIRLTGFLWSWLVISSTIILFFKGLLIIAKKSFIFDEKTKKTLFPDEP